MKSKIKLALSTLAVIAIIASALPARAVEPPKVGYAAPDFTLYMLNGKAVTLSQESAKEPVVLVVLRGWPGYQCPLCTQQVHDFVRQADALNGKARVLMVYPGPANDLKAHAQDFLKDKQWPDKFLFVTDPDYTFTKSYGLRWDSPGETAYPSTFIIDASNKIRFAKISKSHGGRSSVAEIMNVLNTVAK